MSGDETPAVGVPVVNPPRVELLREAAALISGDRNKDYGSPKINFSRTAQIWSVIMGIEFTEADVAMMMIAVKVARYAEKKKHVPDTWRDIAGYAGCGYEVDEEGNYNTI
jgi:hypothetical protein